jgi:hypothetical protein
MMVDLDGNIVGLKLQRSRCSKYAELEVYRQKHRIIANLLIDNIGEMPT